MRKNKHRRFIPAVEYLREPILIEAERATRLPLRLALFHLTSQADRNGVVPLDLMAIEDKAPGDDFNWERITDLLAAAGFLTYFGGYNDASYIQLRGWNRIQTPHDKEKAIYPEPEDKYCYLTPQKLDWKPWQRAGGINTVPVVQFQTTIEDQLLTAAAGNVSTSATDITPILDLIETGIPLESILQSVHDWVAQDQTKLNSWGEAWLLTAIQTDWANRPAAQPQPNRETMPVESPRGETAHSPISPRTEPDAPVYADGFSVTENTFTGTRSTQPPAVPVAIMPDGITMFSHPAFIATPPILGLDGRPRAMEGQCPYDDCIYPECSPKMGCPKHLFETPTYLTWKARQPPFQPPANPANHPPNPMGGPSDTPSQDTAEMGGAPAGAENSLPSMSPAGVPWSDLLDGYVAGNVAWDAGWGPKPGAGGCRVPVELLREYGLEAG